MDCFYTPSLVKHPLSPTGIVMPPTYQFQPSAPPPPPPPGVPFQQAASKPWGVGYVLDRTPALFQTLQLTPTLNNEEQPTGVPAAPEYCFRPL